MNIDWDERYQIGDTPWDKGQAHPGLVEWLKSDPMNGRILVPGCGRGHDVRAIAKAGGISTKVTGLDIAPSAIAAAKRFLPKEDHTAYTQGNLFTLPDLWTATFDGAFEHTCFCAIQPMDRTAYAKAMANLLKPKAQFRAIFFLNPDHNEEGPPYGCSREELILLFTPYFNLDKEIAISSTYPGREGRECGMIWYRK